MSTPGQTWDASLYQSAHAFVWRMAADLLDLLDPKPGERILDLGCGTGQLTAQIADRGATVVGLDRSTDMIERARCNFPNVPFKQGDAIDFTVDEPFDAVFSNATLHWVKPPADAVARIGAALKPGGRFIAEFGGRGNVGAICDGLRHAMREIAGLHFDDLDPWYFPSVGEYAAVLEGAGFEVSLAALFDRPTPLEAGEQGMANWVRMFGASLLDRVEPSRREAVVAATCEHVRPKLYRDGQWSADYRRIRVVARKPPV